MKIFSSISTALMLLGDVRYFDKNKAKIEAAKKAGDFAEERKWILDSTSAFGPMIMRQFECDLHIHGEENIPDEGPVVIMSNHQGYADIPVLFACFRKFQFGFIAKKYLAKIPFYGKWMLRVRSVFIENDDPRESLRAISKGVEYINDGFSMAICPEGTRSRGPRVGQFMKGAMKLATKPAVPIVPVALNGTYKMYEEQGITKGVRIDVRIFPAVPTEGISRKEEKELAAEIEEKIRNGVAELAALQEKG